MNTKRISLIVAAALATSLAAIPSAQADMQIMKMQIAFLAVVILVSVLATDAVMSDGAIPVPTHLPQSVELVRQDLATRLAITPDSIEVTRVEETVWPDTCLGLPAPEICAPGKTPGYRVNLRAFGQNYHYHTDRNETFRFAGPGDAPRRP